MMPTSSPAKCSTSVAASRDSRHFGVFARAAGLPTLKLHGLCYTAASLALAAGVPMKVVSEELGHSSMTITADTYSHVTPAVAKGAAEKVAKLLPRAGRLATGCPAPFPVVL
jgi:integrase